jgi:hypothetical protein
MFALPLKITVPEGSVNLEELKEYLSQNIQLENVKYTIRGKKMLWVRKSPIEGAMIFVRKKNLQVQGYFGEMWMMILFAIGMVITGAIIAILLYMLVIQPKQQQLMDQHVNPKVYDFLRSKGIQFS